MPSPLPSSPALDSFRHAMAERYSLERELGRGGMGVVYLARELKLDRPVALKVLLPEFATQVALRDRFLRETRTAASFSHPNIVPVYAVEEADEYLAYAMGMVEGETLKQRVDRTGPLPVRELVRLIQDVAYALAYAHGRGVVHRDIKPENVMLERATGRALVLDFGISRSMTQTVTAPNLTRVGEVVGTLEYMSPEQISGDVVDGRSDLYALGLTAYFAATGQAAVTGETTQQIMVRQLTEPIVPVNQSRPDLPAALGAVIDRCVQKNPADRFPTAEALVEEIDAAQLAEPDIPVPIRLFAGELSALSFAVLGVAAVIALFVRTQVSSNESFLDLSLPVVALLALMVTRVLTTIGESRRLAQSGFSADEVSDGLSRVMSERAEHRYALHDRAETRRRRRLSLVWGAAMFVAALVMVRLTFALRVRISPTQYRVGALGTVLIYTGVIMLGTSVVLLLKSPFRMPLGERLYRLIWLGPFGRGFVRLSASGLHPDGMPTPNAHTPVVRIAKGPRTSSHKNVVRNVPTDSLAALEARVDALERQAERRGA